MQSTTSVLRSAVGLGSNAHDPRRAASGPPPVQGPSGDGIVAAGPSTAQILELGVGCRATIVRSQPLGMRNQTGDDFYALVLSVRVPGRVPFQIQVSDQVSVAARALLSPGSTLPAKRLPDGADCDVAIDWATALAQVTDMPA
jgi:hypothetical protein